jgi:hypothetical protein
VKNIELFIEWEKFKINPTSPVFNFCAYLFLISDIFKYNLLQKDFSLKKNIQVSFNVLLFY